MDTKFQSKNAAFISSDLNVKVAWLYHVEGMTQEAIASLLDVGRSTVVRSLAASSADHLVITTVNAKSAYQVELERKLEERWGLESAIVVPAPHDPKHLERSIGHAVATYVNQHVNDGMTVAVGGGATLHSSLDFMHRRMLQDTVVVSLVGSLPFSKWINPSIVASKMAERLGVESYQISAPVVLEDADLRDRLWAQPMLAEVRRRARKADLAILTVGEVAPTATIFKHGIVPMKLIEPLQKLGAVANILCCFVNAKGHLVDHPINRCIMSLLPEEVASVGRIILAAGGTHKVAGIRAALRAVKARILITDSETAEKLLEM